MLLVHGAQHTCRAGSCEFKEHPAFGESRRLEFELGAGFEFLAKVIGCDCGRYSLAVIRRRRRTLRSPVQELRAVALGSAPFPADMA